MYGENVLGQASCLHDCRLAAANDASAGEAERCRFGRKNPEEFPGCADDDSAKNSRGAPQRRQCLGCSYVDKKAARYARAAWFGEPASYSSITDSRDQLSGSLGSPCNEPAQADLSRASLTAASWIVWGYLKKLKPAT